jgi:hypothetical protein
MVDFAAYAVLALTTQSAAGVTMLALPVPNEPSLRGRALLLQGATFETSTQVLVLSNPAVVVCE